MNYTKDFFSRFKRNIIQVHVWAIKHHFLAKKKKKQFNEKKNKKRGSF